jgi:alkylation response protein AidB-like acyl-CoA dehydrogenase
VSAGVLKFEEAQAQDTLMDSARELVPILRAARDEIDDAARLPEVLAERMKEAGLYSMTAPREFGGLQCDLRTWQRVVTEIGRGDAGAAWGLTLVTACNWMAAAMFPKHVSEEIFSTRGRSAAGVFSGRAVKARPAPGGIHVDKGMWFFNSGVYQADWNLLGVPMFDASGAVAGPGVAAVPMSDVINLHDWDPTGLRGSGSTNVAMEDIFIPNERIVSLMDCNNGTAPLSYPDVSAYNMAFGPLMVVVLTFPVLGLASHMAEVYLETVGKRDIKLTPYTNQAQAPVTHLQVGEVMAMFDAASNVVSASVAEIEHWAAKREMMPLEARARATRDSAFADKLVFDGASIFANASGGSFSSRRNLMNRLWQDAKVGTLHPFVNAASNFENYGRLACKVEGMLMQV